VRVARRLSPHVDQLKQVCLVLDITGENQKHLSRRKTGSLAIFWRENATYLPNNRELWPLFSKKYSLSGTISRRLFRNQIAENKVR
jgi:hypothetical protein